LQHFILIQDLGRDPRTLRKIVDTLFKAMPTIFVISLNVHLSLAWLPLLGMIR